MPKVERGRLDGYHGMERFTACELRALANKFEIQIADPTNEDDPKYLRRWANKIRKLATRKEKSLEHKIGQS